MDIYDHEHIYAVYDTTGIQSYIFASNNLKENAGASELVHKVLNDYLSQALIEAFGEQDIILDWKSRLDKPLAFCHSDQTPVKKAEIIYVGGGNAYVAFADIPAYTKATKAFLLNVYDKTAGIGVASAYVETSFSDGFYKQHKELQKKLSQAKGKINRPIPAGNQPITRASRLTGLPAAGFGPKPEYELLSAEQTIKRGAQTSPFEKFDELTRGNSYLAVIHVDGNRIGRQIEEYCNGDDWASMVPRVRTMSYRISRLYELAYSCSKDIFNEFYKTTQYAKDKPLLPLIKIIGDGDDITAVVAGQYGISLAARLLRSIEALGYGGQVSLDTDGSGYEMFIDPDTGNRPEVYPFPDWDNTVHSKPHITACAGVVVFHSHYPFSAAYEMAKACCGNAKRYTRNPEEHTQGVIGSFIDFHLHQSGAVVNLDSFRYEQYMTASGYLLCRPYCVSNDGVFNGNYPLYSDFERLMNEWTKKQKSVTGSSSPWPRSRLKALRNAMGDNNDEIAKVLAWCSSRGYTLPEKRNAVTAIDDRNNNNHALQKSDYSMLFDVLELADVYEYISVKEAK